jgi:hypothetical protein
VFRVIPSILGFSNITGNISITNDNPSFVFSDESGLNNNTQLFYTVPVKFATVNATRKGCSIDVNFFTENEINVSHYEIQVSKDGINFVTVAQVNAANRPSYTKGFVLTDELQAAQLFVRVRSVDFDGRFGYSEVKRVSGTCDAKLQYNIYPNPVTGMNITVRATSGIFNGKYSIAVVDMMGRLITRQQVSLTNTTQFEFKAGAISSGKYILRVSESDGADAVSLPFEKL